MSTEDTISDNHSLSSQRVNVSSKPIRLPFNINNPNADLRQPTAIISNCSSSTGSSRSSILKPEFAISSLSLGTFIHHTLPHKIRVASNHGYNGIEIFIADLEDFFRQCGMGMHKDVLEENFDSKTKSTSIQQFELNCAHALSCLCDRLKLRIVCLQPLRDFEGIGHDDYLLQYSLSKADRYLRIAKALRTNLLLVCSNNLAPFDPLSMPGTSYNHYRDCQVKALKALGKRAAEFDISIGYEPLAWGTVINTWQQVWDIVKCVDMDNVGVILDTFNSLANFYADPSRPSGVKDGITYGDLCNYLEELFETIPPQKLFLLQVADAQKPRQIFTSSRNAPATMKWSRTSRLFPCEELEGAYLPVEEYIRTIMELGYNGVWSLEIFSTSLDSDSGDTSACHARRGIEGLEKLYARIAYENNAN